MNKRGQLFVMSAPSGTGKTTLCNLLLKEFPTISYSVSYTTRPPRPGEVNGMHYHFTDTVGFTAMVQRGEFLEHAVVHENMYGTSQKAIDEKLAAGFDILLDIDPQGAMQIKDQIGYGVYIFIAPPTMEALSDRLIKRNDTAATVNVRMKNALKEIEYIPSYDYAIVNDMLPEAYKMLSSIYIAEKCRTKLIVDFGKIVKK